MSKNNKNVNKFYTRQALCGERPMHMKTSNSSHCNTGSVLTKMKAFNFMLTDVFCL